MLILVAAFGWDSAVIAGDGRAAVITSNDDLFAFASVDPDLLTGLGEKLRAAKVDVLT
jgi:hypothetical protein